MSECPPRCNDGVKYGFLKLCSVPRLRHGVSEKTTDMASIQTLGHLPEDHGSMQATWVRHVSYVAKLVQPQRRWRVGMQPKSRMEAVPRCG